MIWSLCSELIKILLYIADNSIDFKKSFAEYRWLYNLELGTSLIENHVFSIVLTVSYAICLMLVSDHLTPLLKILCVVLCHCSSACAIIEFNEKHVYSFGWHFPFVNSLEHKSFFQRFLFVKKNHLLLCLDYAPNLYSYITIEIGTLCV